MARGRRYGRPDSGDLFLVMILNALVGCGLLVILCHAFAVRAAVLHMHGVAHEALLARPELLFAAALAPGAGIAFGCLWYWLVITGRQRGVPWGAAALYGVGIACADMPFAGMLWGLLDGNPFKGALIGLLVLLLVAEVRAALIAFGLAMGLLNGGIAHRWIDYYRSRG